MGRLRPDVMDVDGALAVGSSTAGRWCRVCLLLLNCYHAHACTPYGVAVSAPTLIRGGGFILTTTHPALPASLLYPLVRTAPAPIHPHRFSFYPLATA